MRRPWLLLALLVALPFAGCFQPDQPPCAFACGDGNLCPTGYSCLPDGYCHRAGHTGACGFTDLSANVTDLAGLDLAPVDMTTTPVDGMPDGPLACTSQAQCGAGKYCTNLAGGSCASCSMTDPAICGSASTAAGCLQCVTTTPICVAGGCTACTSDGQCGVGKYCDGSGACLACGATDPVHCGTSATVAGCLPCTGTMPICTGGSCVGCTNNAMCGNGKFCNTGTGACTSCSMTDPTRCGVAGTAPGCLQCVGGNPDCVSGACTCVETVNNCAGLCGMVPRKCGGNLDCTANTCTAPNTCGGVTANVCGATCTPNALTCTGSQPMKCNAGGTAWAPEGAACTGNTPVCSSGTCVACSSSAQCATGQYCDSPGTGACLSCSLTDPAHCGTPTTPAGCLPACSNTTPACAAGACTACPNDAFCRVGKYCDNPGTGACIACAASNNTRCGTVATPAGCINCLTTTQTCNTEGVCVP